MAGMSLETDRNIPDGEEEYRLRLRAVLLQYPFLSPIARGLMTMSASDEEWLQAAEDISRGPFPDNPEKLNILLKRDPGLPAKYGFLMTSAILENPSIRPELKEQIAHIVYKKPAEEDNG